MRFAQCRLPTRQLILFPGTGLLASVRLNMMLSMTVSSALFLLIFCATGPVSYVNCNRLKQKAQRPDNAIGIEKSFGIMILDATVMFFYDDIQ
jgi:hypothetical protein